MYTGASQAFVTKLNSDNRGPFLLRLSEGNTVKTVTSREMTYVGGTNADDYITLGSAVCAYVELTLSKPDFLMQGHEYKVEIGLDINGTPEYVPLGLFTAERPVDDGEDITVTMYDRMAKFEKAYFSQLTYPAGTAAVIQELCTKCSVPYVTPSVSAQIATKPEGYTCREMLVYVAQVLGGFFVINRSGSLEFRWYSASGYTIPQGRYWDPFDKSESDYTLTKITAVIGKEENQSGDNVDKTISKGTGVKALTFENPFYTDTIAQAVYNRISGLTFRPGSLEAPGDIRLEPGDIITVTDRAGTSYSLPVMTLEFNYDGGLSMRIEAVGDEEQPDDFSAKGPTTQAIERMTSRLITAERILANKVDVETLVADYATITSLNALTARIEDIETVNLEADTAIVNRLVAAEGSISSLSSTVADISSAHISVLETDMASIQSLLAGNAATTTAEMIHLNAANALIDTAFIKSILAANVTVDDLKAGTIYTNKQTIQSPDGALVITGSVMQFKDADGNVRIQQGKDGNGNYSFTIFDEDGNAVWYEDGITANGIPSGIIVDDMVAGATGSYAGISASKLNINSVIGGINQAGGLKSTSIYLDEEQQTLNLAFGQMKTMVNGAVKTMTAYYAANQSTTTAPSGAGTTPGSAWSTDVPAWQDGYYIWTYTVTEDVDGTKTATDPVCMSGATGDAGSQIWTSTAAPTSPNYTFAISSLTGQDGLSPKVGDIVMYSYYRYTITSVSSTTVRAGNRQSIRGAAGATGATGDAGEDAILLRIDSSKGNVFKNNTVSTILSVVVFYGGNTIDTSAKLTTAFGLGAHLEWEWLRITDETWGTISASDSRLSDNGFHFTLTPADVDTKVAFRCNLVID